MKVIATRAAFMPARGLFGFKFRRETAFHYFHRIGSMSTVFTPSPNINTPSCTVA
jgi:hypothetical protein